MEMVISIWLRCGCGTVATAHNVIYAIAWTVFCSGSKRRFYLHMTTVINMADDRYCAFKSLLPIKCSFGGFFSTFFNIKKIETVVWTLVPCIDSTKEHEKKKRIFLLEKTIFLPKKPNISTEIHQFSTKNASIFYQKMPRISKWNLIKTEINLSTGGIRANHT